MLGLVCVAHIHAESAHVAVPPAGKLYHGFYWGGIGTDEHDPTEHDVTPNDVAQYEQAIGKRTAWIYFSDNWRENFQPRRAAGSVSSRKFRTSG